jgi:hypothetical protein
VEAVLIDPDTRAIRFYQRLGFKPVEERRFGPRTAKVPIPEGETKARTEGCGGGRSPEAQPPTSNYDALLFVTPRSSGHLRSS